ncbi:MAG: hypothetical protein IRY99_03790 [Isosphaeraceae bacterium]|nr:hypothetical protein [Isosphaeraceae bacterium]
MLHADPSVSRTYTPRVAAGRLEPNRARAERIARRRAELAAEARRLLRRCEVARAIAARCGPGVRGMDAAAAEAISARAMRRAAEQHLRFLRVIDALVSAGGFDEAILILRQRRGGLASNPNA